MNLNLPVRQYAEEITNTLKECSTLIVVGETGSGKSTQVPQILLERKFFDDSFSCVCTQPRRVAAVTLAQQVAKERYLYNLKRKESKNKIQSINHTPPNNYNLGQEVGYSIRFDNKSTKQTKIKYVTDGILLREAISDPLLSKYNVIILDEIHERSLETDILMGLLKMLQEKRKNDLKIILMSATLNINQFYDYFLDIKVLKIPGRQYPVEIFYLKDPEDDYINSSLLACMQIHEDEPAGDVLVFLPGQEDIENLKELLEEKLPNCNEHNDLKHQKKLINEEKKKKILEELEQIEESQKKKIRLNDDNEENQNDQIENDKITPKEVNIDDLKSFIICPLYASMPPDEQLKVFQKTPLGFRKFILATNIAETSVTISGIKYVIDLGYAKTKLVSSIATSSGSSSTSLQNNSYHTSFTMELLKVLPISKSQANQRAGRAGRESEGKCFRLYTERSYEQLAPNSIPEIQRINLSQVLLLLKSMGIKSPTAFPFLTPPNETILRNSLIQLYLLGALNKEQELTNHGKLMADIPLEPNLSNLLIKSLEFNCLNEVLTLVSILSSESIFLISSNSNEKVNPYKNFFSNDGDLISLIKIYNQFIKSNKSKEWCANNSFSHRNLLTSFNIRTQLLSILADKLKINDNHLRPSFPSTEPLLRCLLNALPFNLAKKNEVVQNKSNNDKSQSNIFNPKNFITKNSKNAMIFKDEIVTAPYVTVRGNQPVYIHPSSSLFSLANNRKKLPEYVIFSELLTTNKQYMKLVSRIEADWVTNNQK